MGFEEVAKSLCNFAKKEGQSKVQAVVRAKGRNGLTPLHYAALSGQYEVAELLVYQGSMIDAKDRKIGWTPLHCTAENGQTSVVKLLLDRGAKVEEKDDQVGWTPLHFAAMNGHKAVVRELVRRGAGVNKTDKFGWTPLHFAAMNWQRAVVKDLIRQGAIAGGTIFNWTPGVTENHEGVVEWFKENCSDFNSTTCTRLHLTAVDGWIRTARSIVDSCMAISANGVKSDGLMHWAARDGRNGTISFLVQIGVDVKAANEDGWTPLHCAADNGHETVVQLLVKLGAEIDPIDKGGWTPLHRAAERGYEAVVQLLVKVGAKIDVKNDGRTFLQEKYEFPIGALRSSSASQRGIEQTHDGLDQRILEELTRRAHYDVEGFFERYFEEKTWTNKAGDICENSM